MKLFLLIITVFILVMLAYFLTVTAIKTWRGCSMEEAEEKLHNFLNREGQPYRFYNDPGFSDAVWSNVKGIIGSRRFRQLENIADTAVWPPLLNFGMDSGLPCVNISMYYNNSNEQQVLENVLAGVVKHYLVISGFSGQILADWKVRPDLNMPYLEIRYFRNEKEKQIFDITMKDRQNAAIMQHIPLFDDTEDEDLADD